MASIQGSQFVATAPGQNVHVGITADGSNLPPPVPGQFNLEVYTGSGAPPAIAPGYQGLAVLGAGGNLIDLISGTFEVQDAGSGNDTLIAHGNNETLAGGAGHETFAVYGTADVVFSISQDTINVLGSADTVHASGHDLINVQGQGAFLDLGAGGNDTVNVDANRTSVINTTGNGNFHISGSGNFVYGGSGHDTIAASGTQNALVGGTGGNLVDLSASQSAYLSRGGNDTINVSGTGDTVVGGTGSSTITLIGSGNTVASAGGNDTINMVGSNEVFLAKSLLDVGTPYHDTIVGFDDASDRIQLTFADNTQQVMATAKLVNNNADTQLTLGDGSTILLKGVTHVTQADFLN